MKIITFAKTGVSNWLIKEQNAIITNTKKHKNSTMFPALVLG